MSTFYRKLESPTTNTGKLKRDFKQKFPEVFSGGLCEMYKNQNTVPGKGQCPLRSFKKGKRSFRGSEHINDELDSLERADFNEWSGSTVYVRKKSYQIRVSADFSTGLKQAVKHHHYPLPCPEEIFNKHNGGKIFFKNRFIRRITSNRGGSK